MSKPDHFDCGDFLRWSDTTYLLFTVEPAKCDSSGTWIIDNVFTDEIVFYGSSMSRGRLHPVTLLHMYQLCVGTQGE